MRRLLLHFLCSLFALNFPTVLHQRGCARITSQFQSRNGGSCTVFFGQAVRHFGLGQAVKSTHCMLSSPALWGNTTQSWTSKKNHVVCAAKQSRVTRRLLNARSALFGTMSTVPICLLDLMRTLGSIQIWPVWICNSCTFPNFSTTFLLNNL